MNQRKNDGGLTFRDCVLLGALFEEQAAMLFPFPATVRLFTGRLREICPEYDRWPAFLANHWHPDGRPKPVTSLIGYHDGVVYCPLALSDEGLAVLGFSGPDRGLLKKFSPDWYRSFQQQVQQNMQSMRQGYIDPETGLYNRRALLTCMERQGRGAERARQSATLYLVHLSFIRRSIPGTLRRLSFFADLLATIENQGLFFLGQGLFALLWQAPDQEQERLFARRLQKFLRRENLQRVQVAFADWNTFVSLPEAETDLFAALVKALALAERRGPFGICDARVLAGQAMHPFVMPSRPVVRKLQRLWQSMQLYCLALFTLQEGVKGGDSLSSALARLVGEDGECYRMVPAAPGEVFVLISVADRFDPVVCIQKLHRGLQQSLPGQVSVGYCIYPDDSASKTGCIRCCYKARMHGEFFGAGAVVHFDHVSLNVSGDWYFEQGDFRQAVREYSQGLARMPGENNLLNSLGVALVEMKRISQAVTCFDEVLSRDPDNHMALVNLGYAYLQQERLGKALTCFEKAHAVQYHAGIEGVDVLRQLSRLYIQFERFQDALAILHRWRQTEDTGHDFLFHRLMGRACLETGSTGQAMQALQKALHLHPSDGEAMSLLGLLYIRKNEGEEAGRILLEKALSLDGSRAVYWYRYGAALLHLARYDEAIAAVRKSLCLKKTDIDAGLLLVEILLRQQKMKLARRHLDRLLARNAMNTGQKQRTAKLFSEFFDKSKKAT